MEAVLGQVEQLPALLAVSRSALVRDWDSLTLDRALEWARYFQHLHERFRARPQLREALERRLRRAQPYPPLGFPALGRCPQLLGLALLENRALPPAACHRLLRGFLQPPGSGAGSEPLSLALLARRKAAARLLALPRRSPGPEPEPEAEVEAQLLLARLREEKRPPWLCGVLEQLPQPRSLQVVAAALALLGPDGDGAGDRGGSSPHGDGGGSSPHGDGGGSSPHGDGGGSSPHGDGGGSSPEGDGGGSSPDGDGGGSGPHGDPGGSSPHGDPGGSGPHGDPGGSGPHGDGGGSGPHGDGGGSGPHGDGGGSGPHGDGGGSSPHGCQASASGDGCTAELLLSWLLGSQERFSAFCLCLPGSLLAFLAGRYSRLSRVYLELLTGWGSRLLYDPLQGRWIKSCHGKAELSWEELRERFKCLCQGSTVLKEQTQAALKLLKTRDGDFEVRGLSVWTDLLLEVEEKSANVQTQKQREQLQKRANVVNFI